MNKHIDTYRTIYGVDIVIANIKTTIEDLRETLVYNNGDELSDSLLDYQAVTTTCKNRKTGRYSILVKLNSYNNVTDANRKLDLINTAAHESVHVAMNLFSFSQEEVNPDASNETLAYLIGWITECIYNNWTKK